MGTQPAAPEAPAIDRRALRWDGTVTAGNLLTACAMFFALMVWGMRLEGRVEQGEARLVRLEVARDRDDRETGQTREVLAAVRENQVTQMEMLRRLENWSRTVATTPR